MSAAWLLISVYAAACWGFVLGAHMARRLGDPHEAKILRGRIIRAAFAPILIPLVTVWEIWTEFAPASWRRKGGRS